MKKFKAAILFSSLLFSGSAFAGRLQLELVIPIPAPVVVVPAQPVVTFQQCGVSATPVWNGARYVPVYTNDCIAQMIDPQIINQARISADLQLALGACRIQTLNGLAYDQLCVDRIHFTNNEGFSIGFWEGIRPFHEHYAVHPDRHEERREERHEDRRERYRPFGMLEDIQDQLKNMNGAPSDASNREADRLAKNQSNATATSEQISMISSAGAN